ncbi:MAG TPA: ZPR1 zinc finger domain-containing protein [Pyrodictium sp.]|nr:ZPR1 zinc finger domain-containing protein [Pyrodictium sp.]
MQIPEQWFSEEWWKKEIEQSLRESLIPLAGTCNLECPACGTKSLCIEDYLYRHGLGDPIVISVSRCSRCGYKSVDVSVAEPHEPVRIIVVVVKPEDLDSLVVKNSKAAIIFPELGLEMWPGPASQGIVTTVEGILLRFREIVESLCKKQDVDKSECEKRKQMIDWALKRYDRRSDDERYVMILDDPEGASYVYGERVLITTLTENVNYLEVAQEAKETIRWVETNQKILGI